MMHTSMCHADFRLGSGAAVPRPRQWQKQGTCFRTSYKLFLLYIYVGTMPWLSAGANVNRLYLGADTNGAAIVKAYTTTTADTTADTTYTTTD